MRQIVQKRFGRPITIDLLEKLQLPSSSSNTSTTNNNNTNISNNTNTTQVTQTNIVNQSLLNQQHSTPVLQQPLYTTVQPQQKINILQQTPQQTLIGSTASLLSQQQQLQQQARTQIVCYIIRASFLQFYVNKIILEYNWHSSVSHIYILNSKYKSAWWTTTSSARNTNDNTTVRFHFTTSIFILINNTSTTTNNHC